MNIKITKEIDHFIESLYTTSNFHFKSKYYFFHLQRKVFFYFIEEERDKENCFQPTLIIKRVLNKNKISIIIVNK